MATMSNGSSAVQNGIVATLDRIGDVSIARPAEYMQRRLEEQTAALSVKQRYEATAHLLNAALSRYVALVYEPLADGTPAGIDPVSGTVRIKAPWASNSYRAWSLRRQEQIVMLAALKHWQRATTGAPPLFRYNRVTNRWQANLDDYPDLRSALAVLRNGVFTAESVAHWEQSERARDARRRTKGRP